MQLITTSEDKSTTTPLLALFMRVLRKCVSRLAMHERRTRPFSLNYWLQWWKAEVEVEVEVEEEEEE